MSHYLVAIDPGGSGAVAWRGVNGVLQVEYMPETNEEILGLFTRCVDQYGCNLAVMEDVGTYMPGNSGPAAVTFARHCGNLDMALVATFGPRVRLARPQEWMKAMPLTKFDPVPRTLPEAERRKILGHRKQIRKDEIKQHVQKRFPSIKVTLKNADALGILLWAETTEGIHGQGE